MEQWKAVNGYEGLYEVSNTGKVRSLDYRRTGEVRELSQLHTSCGYLYVALWKERECKRFYVHRLVAEAFIGEIPEGLVINHKDETPQNNNVENLEICTQKYNSNYGSHNERLSAALKGRKLPPETRAKMSAAKKGKTPWNKGKKLSPETRVKMSAAHVLHYANKNANTSCQLLGE